MKKTEETAVSGLREVLGIVERQGRVVTAVGCAAAVLALHVGVSKWLFSCPCYYDDLVLVTREQGDPAALTSLHRNPVPPGRLLYSLSFIIWPALLCCSLGLLLNKHTKRCLLSSGPHCDCRQHCHALSYLLRHSALCFLMPLLWLLLCLLDGRYYECLVSAAPQECITPEFKFTQVKEALALENHQLRAFSQALGLSVFGLVIIIAVFVILCCHFFSSKTYFQDRYMSIYRDKEIQTFSRISMTMLEEDIAKKWRLFFRLSSKQSDWDEVAGLPFSEAQLVGDKYVTTALDAWCASISKPPTSQPPRPPLLRLTDTSDKEPTTAKMSTNASDFKEKVYGSADCPEYAIVTSSLNGPDISEISEKRRSVRFEDANDDNNNDKFLSNYDTVSIAPIYSLPLKVGTKSVGIQAVTPPPSPVQKRRDTKRTVKVMRSNSANHEICNSEESETQRSKATRSYSLHDYDNVRGSALAQLSAISAASDVSAVSTIERDGQDSEDSDTSLTSVTTTSSSIHFINVANDRTPIVIQPSLPHKPSHVVNAIGVNSAVVKKGYVQSLIEKKNTQSKQDPRPPYKEKSSESRRKKQK